MQQQFDVVEKAQVKPQALAGALASQPRP